MARRIGRFPQLVRPGFIAERWHHSGGIYRDQRLGLWAMDAIDVLVLQVIDLRAIDVCARLAFQKNAFHWRFARRAGRRPSGP